MLVDVDEGGWGRLTTRRQCLILIVPLWLCVVEYRIWCLDGIRVAWSPSDSAEPILLLSLVVILTSIVTRFCLTFAGGNIDPIILIILCPVLFSGAVLVPVTALSLTIRIALEGSQNLQLSRTGIYPVFAISSAFAAWIAIADQRLLQKTWILGDAIPISEDKNTAAERLILRFTSTLEPASSRRSAVRPAKLWTMAILHLLAGIFGIISSRTAVRVYSRTLDETDVEAIDFASVIAAGMIGLLIFIGSVACLGIIAASECRQQIAWSYLPRTVPHATFSSALVVLGVLSSCTSASLSRSIPESVWDGGGSLLLFASCATSITTELVAILHTIMAERPPENHSDYTQIPATSLDKAPIPVAANSVDVSTESTALPFPEKQLNKLYCSMQFELVFCSALSGGFTIAQYIKYLRSDDQSIATLDKVEPTILIAAGIISSLILRLAFRGLSVRVERKNITISVPPSMICAQHVENGLATLALGCTLVILEASLVSQRYASSATPMMSGVVVLPWVAAVFAFVCGALQMLMAKRLHRRQVSDVIKSASQSALRDAHTTEKASQ